MHVKSNKNWRQFVYRHDVPAAILASQFDWVDPEETDYFLKYKGTWYHLSEFERYNGPNWRAIRTESWSQGVLLNISANCETYQIGSYWI